MQGNITRTGANRLKIELLQGQSAILLGPRQVGKTTLIHMVTEDLPHVTALNLLRARDRDRYILDPDLLLDEITLKLRSTPNQTIYLVIDEVQRVPRLLDAVQLLLDEHKGRLVCLLSGSSARKLKRGEANLLPGRVTKHLLYPLDARECMQAGWTARKACCFGRLPGIVTAPTDALRKRTLEAYVDTYLQEEIREEGLVRNYGAFRSFLQLAAEHSGGEVSYQNLSRRSGVTANTIKNYYEILQDTLTAFELPPINTLVSLPGKSGRRQSKTAKNYLFDPGIINAILQRWRPTSADQGLLLEHLVLCDLLAWFEQEPDGAGKLGYWRQHQGHEVDFVLSGDRGLTGIEVKLTRQPGRRDLRGLQELHRVHGLQRAIVACDIERSLDLGRSWQASGREAAAPPDLVVAAPFAEVVSMLAG